MEERFARHGRTGAAFRAAMKAIGVGLIPIKEENAANTLSAPWFPESIDPADFMKAMGATGVIIAGGLLPELKTKYFRVGHMGSVNRNDLLATVAAIESALTKCGHKFEAGSGLQTVNTML